MSQAEFASKCLSHFHSLTPPKNKAFIRIIFMFPFKSCKIILCLSECKWVCEQELLFIIHFPCFFHSSYISSVFLCVKSEIFMLHARAVYNGVARTKCYRDVGMSLWLSDGWKKKVASVCRSGSGHSFIMFAIE